MKQMSGSNASAVTLTPVADAPVADTPKVAASGATPGRSARSVRTIRPCAALQKTECPRKTRRGSAGRAGSHAAHASRQQCSFSTGERPNGFLAAGSAGSYSLRGAAQSTSSASPAPVAGNAKPAGSNGSPVAQETDDPLKGWRLTAIIAGQYPRAVIEGVGTGPTLVGDRRARSRAECDGHSGARDRAAGRAASIHAAPAMPRLPHRKRAKTPETAKTKARKKRWTQYPLPK